MNKVLIVGANSKLSINLAKIYIDSGHDVYGISREKTFNNSSLYKDIIYYDENFYGIDFCEVVIVACCDPNVVTKLSDMLDINLHIVNKAISSGGKLARYIFISTITLYSQNSIVIDENALFNTSNNYGISKLVSEKYLQDKILGEVLILRVPVLLCEGVSKNFMAKLKYQVAIGGEYTFTNPDSYVNAFFSIDDFSLLVKSVKSGVINCHTKIDWKISDIIDYSVKCGLKSYKVIEGSKPSQIISENSIQFSKTSSAIKKFIIPIRQ